MTSNIDVSRMAFALAQSTLSMLSAAGLLDKRMLDAAADAIDRDGSIGLSREEASLLVRIIRDLAAKGTARST